MPGIEKTKKLNKLITISFLEQFVSFSIPGAAFYECCDPLSARWVEQKEQLVPYMAVEIFKGNPGAASLFVIAAYGGTLSTFSSGINSMATVVVTDFVRPNEQRLKGRLPLFTGSV